MKFIRRAPEPKAEPMPGPPEIPKTEPLDMAEMVRAVQALQAAAERMQAPAVNVTVPEAKKPSAFTVKVTKRDHKGRVEEFDVFVKSEARAENDLEAGFNETTLQ
jgi:hypothetical protein